MIYIPFRTFYSPDLWVFSRSKYEARMQELFDLFDRVMNYLGPEANRDEVAWALGIPREKLHEKDQDDLKRIADSSSYTECIDIYIFSTNSVVGHRARTKALKLAETPYQAKDVWANSSDSYQVRVAAITKVAQLIRKADSVWESA
ncbi:MAG: hypothetical protein WA051_00775 [Minisyncoccia bacterium]